jgi:tRNA modification GTPase
LGKASAEGTGRERLSYIDAAAQSLAAERRAGAAIRLCCIDATGVSSDVSQATVGVADVADCDIVVLTKSDLARVSQQQPDRLNQAGTVVTSSRTGEGIDELCRLIRTLLGTKPVSEQGQALRSTAARCRESIGLAQSAVSRATQIIDQNSGNELAAAELHIALTELGKVVGAVYTDDLLDRVFSTFCIGK